MKLTEKDKQFLETLKSLMESKDLWVELRPGRPSSLVLKGTYGEKVHQSFRMSRQGVRWRFNRVFSEMYASALETILFIEKAFGTQLRENAIRISKERHAERQKWRENGLQSAESLESRRQTQEPARSGRTPEM